MSSIDDTAQGSILQQTNDLQDSPWTSQIEIEATLSTKDDEILLAPRPFGGDEMSFSNVGNLKRTLAAAAEKVFKFGEEMYRRWLAETALPISARIWSRPHDGELNLAGERDGNQGPDTRSRRATCQPGGCGSDEKSIASGRLPRCPAYYISTERSNLRAHPSDLSDVALWIYEEHFPRVSGLRKFGLAGLAVTAATGAGALSFLASDPDRDRWTQLVADPESNSPPTTQADLLAPALVASIAVTTTALTGYHYVNRLNSHQDPMICVVGIAGAIVGFLLGLDPTQVLLRVVPWCVLAALVMSSMWAPRWAEEHRVLLK